MTTFLAALTGLLCGIAHASPFTAGLADGVQTAGSSLTGLAWDGTIGTIFVQIAGEVRPIFGTIAILMISIAGIQLAVSQDEDSTSKAKTTITLCAVGIILAYSTNVFYQAFYNDGSVQQGGAAAGAGILSAEVLKTVNYFAGFVYPLALLSILFSVARSIVLPNDENSTTMKSAVIASIASLVIFNLRMAIAEAAGTVGTANLTPIAQGLISVVNYILAATMAAALLAIVYAALLLVTGSEEQATKAKGIIIRVLIGTVIVFNSGLIINAIVEAVGRGG